MEGVARNKQLHFYWEPGHKRMDGNDIVNDIAKSDVWLSSENVTDIGEPMYCLHHDLPSLQINNYYFNNRI